MKYRFFVALIAATMTTASVPSASIAQTGAEAENVIVACKFERLPLMILTYRPTTGKHTLQVGDTAPVPLESGTGYSSAEFEGQDYSFWIRRPASVTITGRGSDGQTFAGECISSLPR